MLRNTTGDEHSRGRQNTSGFDHLDLNGAADADVVRALLAEIHVMETQLNEGSERLNSGATRIDELEVLVESLRGERDIALASLREAKQNMDHLQQSMAALEFAFDDVGEQRDAHAYEARAAREELAAWVMECELLLQQVQRHSTEIDDLTRLRDDLVSDVKNGREALAAAECARGEAAREINELVGERSDLLRRAGELELTVSALNDAVLSAQERVNASQARIQDLEQRVHSADRYANELVAKNEKTTNELAARLLEAERYTKAADVRIGELETALEEKARRAADRHAYATRLERDLEEVTKSIQSLQVHTSDLEATRLEIIEERDLAFRRADQSDERATALAMQVNELESCRDRLEERIVDLDSGISELESQREYLQSRGVALEADVGRANERIAELGAQIDEKARLVSEGEARAEALSTELRAQRELHDGLIEALRGAERNAQSAKELTAALALQRDEIAAERDQYIRQVEDLRASVARIQRLEIELADSAAEVQRLHAELKAERATQDDLVAALRGAEQAARSTEERISELLSSRSDLALERDALSLRVTELQDVAAAIQGRLEEAESRSSESQNRTTNLERELANACENVQALIDETQAQSTSILALTSQVERLHGELRAERTAADGLVSALQQAETAAKVMETRVVNLASEHSSLAKERDEFASATRQLERRVLQLESHIAESERYVGSLLEQIEQKSNQIAEGGDYARRLEADLTSSNAELEAIRKAAVADKSVMREYIQSLQEQVAHIPALCEAQVQLVSQTETLIAAFQEEGTQLAVLIDTVQASHFWRLKRFLSRARARLFRR